MKKILSLCFLSCAFFNIFQNIDAATSLTGSTKTLSLDSQDFKDLLQENKELLEKNKIKFGQAQISCMFINGYQFLYNITAQIKDVQKNEGKFAIIQKMTLMKIPAY